MRLDSLLSTRQIVLLPPQGRRSPTGFRSVSQSPARYTRLLESLQRLRGSVYLCDGAIQEEDLTADGRHQQPADFSSWHVLSIDSKDQVRGCARLRPFDFPVDYDDLSVGRATVAGSGQWGSRLERAVRQEIARAREQSATFVELGGWALSNELRCGTEALKIAMMMYGLSRVLGGCIGLTTATVRHCSSTILRRIGGDPLSDSEGVIPRYFDSRYKCEMEILRFDSSAPNPKYRGWAEGMASDLLRVPVIAGRRDVLGMAPVVDNEEVRGQMGMMPLVLSA